jgi:hypothetical protein
MSTDFGGKIIEVSGIRCRRTGAVKSGCGCYEAWAFGLGGFPSAWACGCGSEERPFLNRLYR